MSDESRPDLDRTSSSSADAHRRDAVRGTSSSFLAKLRSKYSVGRSSPTMLQAVRETAKRASSGFTFKTGEELGIKSAPRK